MITKEEVVTYFWLDMYESFLVNISITIDIRFTIRRLIESQMVRAVGIEPTRISPADLKTAALDHSAMLASL